MAGFRRKEERGIIMGLKEIVKAGVFSFAVAACGSSAEKREGCVSNNDCSRNRVCLENICQFPPVSAYVPPAEADGGYTPTNTECELGEGTLYLTNGIDIVNRTLCDQNSTVVSTLSQPLRAGSFEMPEVSPDKSKIVFSVSEGENHDRYGYVVDISTGLVSKIQSGEMSRISWFPDSVTVAYFNNEGIGTLNAIRIDGTQKRVIQQYGYSASATWLRVSPDGEHIAISHTPEYGGQFGLYVLDKDGSNTKRLSDYGFQFMWRDNKTILFDSVNDSLNNVSSVSINSGEVRVEWQGERYSPNVPLLQSPDGSHVVIAVTSVSYKIWNTETGEAPYLHGTLPGGPEGDWFEWHLFDWR